VSGASRCYFDIPLHPNAKCKLRVYKGFEFSCTLLSHLNINTTDNHTRIKFPYPISYSLLSTLFQLHQTTTSKMQFFFLTALLVTSTLAAPSLQSHRSMFKRQACDQTNQPTADQVMTAINTWLIDVQTVNSFLDNSITQPGAVVSQAPSVLTFASDEPNELGEFLCPVFCYGTNQSLYLACLVY
jgi:hypothetical protein